MDNLISQRNHVCAEAVATNGTKSSAAVNCADTTTTGGAGSKP
jgi:hypothetical protein